MASEDRGLLQAVLEALPVGAIVQGPADEVLAANGKFAAMFALDGRVDLSPGAPVRPLVPLVQACYAPGYDGLLPMDQDPGCVHVHRVHRSAEIPLADGRVVRRDVAPLRRGDAYLGALWTFLDVSDRKRREHGLERDNLALTELARQRNAFVGAASHELRTPLTTVMSFAELLADPAFGALNEQQSTFVDALRRNADRMQRVIADLLVTTRLRAEHPELEFGPVDVPGMLRDAVLERLAAARGTDVFTVLDCAPGPELRGDRHRLQHVLANLLDNAAKYTPADGRVTVTAAPRGDAWVIEVADTGIGVPADAREAIFSGFVRAANVRTGGYPGTGLGLAISRTVVRLHGGTLTASGTEGEGAVFTITLPLRGPAGGAGERGARGTAAGGEAGR
ncbi:ATP-binding protein [Streptomyces gamaensis]|uniref:histidine kinase n=1 Tax=Streptomyces gamaensis TaxID=1763542 RepID=A0ABW0YXG5_9ACTN